MRSIHVFGVINLLQKVCLKKGSVSEIIEDFFLHIVHFVLFSRKFLILLGNVYRLDAPLLA